MGKSGKIDSIETAEDMDFQRASWRVQRVGWMVMLAVTVAALAGFFGGGPVSTTRTGAISSGLEVEYERFARLYAPQTLVLDIGPTAMDTDSTASIWIDRGWMESNEVTDIIPEPAESEVLPDAIVYTFKASPTAAPLRVRFRLETREFGRMRGRAGIVDGPTVSFAQFVYP